MILKNAAVPFCQFENLSSYPELGHFVSTRAGGVSAPPRDTLDLSYHGRNSPNEAEQNRKALSNALGISWKHIITANQVHGTQIKIVSRSVDDRSCQETKNIDDSDALVTDTPGVCVMVLTADCVPILLYDPVQKVAGAVHAGWKGTLHSIARKTIDIFGQIFKSNPQDIVAGIGPSIGPCCFEVGPEVSRQFADALGHRHILPGKNSGKETIDLWAENARQLMESGLRESQIEQANLCTCHHVHTFFSYRCEDGKTGRFGTGIFIK